MAWLDDILESLAAGPICGYVPSQSAATEPTALAALALAGHDRADAARIAADALADWQNEDGSLGVCVNQLEPGWPTALAVLAWLTVDAAGYQGETRRACAWLVAQHGRALERHPDMGHDTTLDGWPWVLGTHSWLEPTAYSLLALKGAGMGNHARAREAVQLLVDRQLPSGGCNYGNTIVLGQTLRPHVEPTGVALLALAGESDPSGRLPRSLAYLKQAISRTTTAASLGWALQGLAAHGETKSEADGWLAAAAKSVAARDRSAAKFAVLALAALGERSPLVVAARRSGAAAGSAK